MSKQYFAKSEFQGRQRKVREAMGEVGIELLLVIAPVHINYLTGASAKGYQEFQVLFFPLDSGPLILQSRLPEVPMLLADSLVDEVRGWGGREPEDPIAVFKEILHAKGYKGLRVGLEVPGYYLHPHHHNQLVDLLGTDLVMDATDLIGNIKLIKSPAEIAYMRKAGEIVDQGMATCIAAIEPGTTERVISANIHHTLLAAGSDIQASPMNFLSGPRSAFAHGEPSDRVLESGDFMHIHSGPTTDDTVSPSGGNCAWVSRHSACGMFTRSCVTRAMPVWLRCVPGYRLGCHMKLRKRSLQKAAWMSIACT